MAHPIAAAITPRQTEVNPAAGAPFDPVKTGRDFLHLGRVCALSTLDPGGFPYGIVTNVMADADGSPVFFAARLALHARNMLADSRVSLTYAEFDTRDVLTHARMTLVGHARPVPEADDARLRARYLARFPKAKLYLQLPDAVMFRVSVEGVNIGGGPARNAAPVIFDQLRIDISDASALLEAEATLIAAANADPVIPAALARHAGATAGNAGANGRWQLIALDPEGVDLAGREGLRRYRFAERITTAAGFHAALADLTKG